MTGSDADVQERGLAAQLKSIPFIASAVEPDTIAVKSTASGEKEAAASVEAPTSGGGDDGGVPGTPVVIPAGVAGGGGGGVDGGARSEDAVSALSKALAEGKVGGEWAV